MSFARVALVGTGRIGAVHFRNILSNPKIQLVALVEVDPNVREKFTKEANCKGYGSIHDALADEDTQFDGVLVCTPTPFHLEVVEASIKAGKHVFCEKPISHNLEETDTCYELAKEHNVVLLCGFQRRYDPSFVHLLDVVQQGGIGVLQKVRTISRDNPPPSIEYLKTSTGIFHDCLSHDIDLLRWIIGEDPIEVFCYATNFIEGIKEIDDFDNVECLLKWENGIIGSIDVSRKAVYGYDQRITCLGDKGMVSADNVRDTTVIVQDENGTHTDPNSYSFTTRYPKAYAQEIDHFANLILGLEKTQRICHKDVRNNFLIAEALEKSARTGAPVKLALN